MALGTNDTTTKIQHDTADLRGANQTLTICFAVNHHSAGEGAGGRVLQLDETNAAGFLWISSTTTGRMLITKGFGTTQGQWRIPVAYDGWHRVSIAYDYSSTANAPTARVDGAAVTVTQLTAPAGTIQDPATGYCVLNASTQLVTFDGELANLQVFNTILTSERQDLANKFPGSVRAGLRLFLPLDVVGRGGRDLSGQGFHGTETDVQAANGPELQVPVWFGGFGQEAPVTPAGGKPMWAYMRRRRA